MAIPYVRPLTTADLPEVARIQHLCYAPQYHEPPQSFASKLNASAESSWIAERQGHVAGYLVTLPLLERDGLVLPRLSDESVPDSPAEPDWLYLHDLAIDPACRGDGIAGHLIRHAIDFATHKGIRNMGLVAVQSSEAFWRRHGFERVEHGGTTLRAKLDSFGADALFMRQTLKRS